MSVLILLNITGKVEDFILYCFWTWSAYGKLRAMLSPHWPWPPASIWAVFHKRKLLSSRKVTCQVPAI